MKGFTLIETMVVIALFVVVSSALAAFFLSFNSIYGAQQALTRTSGSAGAIVGEVQMNTLQADHVLGTHVFSSSTYSSSATMLVLELPAIDSTGAVVSGKYDYVAIYTNGTNAYRLLQADAASSRRSGTKQLSDSVSVLTFTYDNADFTQVKKVDVDIQTQASLKGQIIHGHLHQQVYLRNI